MTKHRLWVLCGALAIAGAACEKVKGEQRTDERTPPSDVPLGERLPPAEPESLPPAPEPLAAPDQADRDRGPMDQGDSETDLKITQAIRKAVTDDKALSNDAKNVKIITEKRVVVLRGPVQSEAEKASIESKAKGVADVERVDNQLVVKTTK